MQVTSNSRLLNEMSSSRICIDSYEAGEMHGQIFNPYYPEKLEFHNLIQLIKVLDKLFDKFEYPQSTMTRRHFGDEKTTAKSNNDIELLKELNREDFYKTETKGKLATFRIQVRFRQNASWQGTLYWVEGSRQENFRSVLELIMLMDSSFEQSAAKHSFDELSKVSAL